MAENILESYLVKLGFSVDQVGYAKFAAALRSASSLVNNEYFQIAKHTVEIGTAITGGFAAIGTAAIGLADKVAMADQDYRLFALRMYTSLPVARELKVALDALGQPLENAMWDPELAHRFHRLAQDQRALTEQLGPNFEHQMIRIRDLRFEFTRLGVETKYFAMFLTQDLAKAFGTDMDGLLAKMRDFNNWFIREMPRIASEFADVLKPVLIDTREIFSSLWELIKQVVVDFTNFYGLISDNRALMSSTADFHKFAEALADIAHQVATILQGLFKFGTNLGLLVDAGIQAAAGDYSRAVADLGKMRPLSSTGPIEAAAGLAGATANLATPENVRAAIVAQAIQYKVPPELALAVAQQESGFRQFDKYGKVLMSGAFGSHATGVFQLQPGTAEMLGVDPRDAGENIAGGVKYLQLLLAGENGNVKAALERYYGSKNAAENRAYAERVMKIEAGININGPINITVPPGTSPAEARRIVSDGIADAAKQRVQRNLVEFGYTGTTY